MVFFLPLPSSSPLRSRSPFLIACHADGSKPCYLFQAKETVAFTNCLSSATPPQTFHPRSPSPLSAELTISFSPLSSTLPPLFIDVLLLRSLVIVFEIDNRLALLFISALYDLPNVNRIYFLRSFPFRVLRLFLSGVEFTHEVLLK